ncbi:chondroitin sulfate synthase 1 [Plutella xylostella]|uniref:chondroitin sulfate synthase 1 n=1 Tax=Plutella xylostella TaxID=51655 RepID=UPI00203310AB|nr:chondroitin sulfate synthase 1 [Plutella xylostella]
MARRGKWAGLVVGLALGLALGALLRRGGRAPAPCRPAPPDPLALLQLAPNETRDNSRRALVLVGVMTAAQYLDTRARAVHETWARDLPGRLAFFSSEGSRAPGLPLVALRGVDDSYPPQKKSFLMLLHMYEQYGDRFEWFMRADDDVYVRGDRLEAFLRGVDSRKPQFIGQAGRGTAAERDALALAPDENFCMGGPGVLLSRAALAAAAPHVRYCLQHLLTSHEDVELGRCVARFAGVACTWSYDMQTILHHNSSGAAAYTGRLKRREVHRAITLHPVKDHRYMYRLHSYFKNLRIQELREQSVQLHRDISSSLKALGVASDHAQGYTLPGGLPLFPAKIGQAGYLGDNEILGAPVELDRYKPADFDDVVLYDFVSKSIYSTTHQNPKRKIELPLKEALDDVIREVMEIINQPSRQRGRVIDFNELLYGYTRLDALHGADHVLDLLLQYRRYRGRKMTAAVRRHAYLQQSFTGMDIRELPLGDPPSPDGDSYLESTGAASRGDVDYEDFDESNKEQNGFLDLNNINKPLKEAWESGLMKLQNNLPKALTWGADKEYPIYDRRINFILPLAGRLDIFIRFMKNYEDVVLKTDEAVTLIVILYLDGKNPIDYKRSENLIDYYNDNYSSDKQVKAVKMGSTTFSRGAALTEGIKLCEPEDLMFFVDVDMMFNFDTLRRIRINTIKYYQVYFPIVFSEYNPDVVNGEDYNKFKGDNVDTKTDLGRYDNIPTEGKTEREVTNLKYTKRIHDDFGYFRQYGFGILSIYKSDFESVGGFNLTIKGWGMEDVQLFETLIKSNLTVFRIADDSLVHIFHSVDCDKSLEASQYTMCLGTKASTYGSDKHMAYYMLNHPDVLWPPTEDKKGAS